MSSSMEMPLVNAANDDYTRPGEPEVWIVQDFGYSANYNGEGTWLVWDLDYPDEGPWMVTDFDNCAGSSGDEGSWLIYDYSNVVYDSEAESFW